jgi:RND family efflux transporter MFP subunit
LESLYDSHLAISPITGTVMKKMVENGSTVSAGQLLAVVARTEKLKIQFFVDQENLAYLRQGQTVQIRKSDGQSIAGKVWSFSTQADAQTRRFQVEVRLDKDDNQLISGTVVDVVLPIIKKAKDQKNIILPLSAVEIGQNQNFIMIVEGDKAKKVPAEIVKVEGEAVEIKVDLSNDKLIVIDGSKLLEEGDLIKIK